MMNGACPGNAVDIWNFTTQYSREAHELIPVRPISEGRTTRAYDQEWNVE